MSSMPLAPTPRELLAMLSKQGVPTELLERVALFLSENDHRRVHPSVSSSTLCPEHKPCAHRPVILNSRSAPMLPLGNNFADSSPCWWSLRTASDPLTLLSLPDPILSSILRAALGGQTDFASASRHLGAAIDAKIETAQARVVHTVFSSGGDPSLPKDCTDLPTEPWMLALSSSCRAYSYPANPTKPVRKPKWQTRGAQLSAVSKHLRRLMGSSSHWRHCSVCDRDLQEMSADWFAQDLSQRVSPETASSYLRQPWLPESSGLDGQAQQLQLISADALQSLETAARNDFGPLAQMCAGTDCSRHTCYECISSGRASRCAHQVMLSPYRPETSGSRWIIPCNSVFCPDCAPEPCQICLRMFGQPCCGGMEMAVCKLCPLIACTDCEDCWKCGLCKGLFHDRCKQSQFCEACETDYCPECDDDFVCSECTTHFCSTCSEGATSCSGCLDAFCEDCVICCCDCCTEHFCEDCRDISYCDICNTQSCSECDAVKHCSICAVAFCTDCVDMIQCGSCNSYTCSSCAESDCSCGACEGLADVKRCHSCETSFCRRCTSSLIKCSRCEHGFCQDCNVVTACTSCRIRFCETCSNVDETELQRCERCTDRRNLAEAKRLLTQFRASLAHTAGLLEELKWRRAAVALRHNAEVLQPTHGTAESIETETNGTGSPEWMPIFIGRGLHPANSLYADIHTSKCASLQTPMNFVGVRGDDVLSMPMDIVSVTKPWIICDQSVLGHFSMPVENPVDNFLWTKNDGKGSEERFVCTPNDELRTICNLQDCMSEKVHITTSREHEHKDRAVLVDFVCMALGCMPEYMGKSPEELRLEDYVSGKVHGDPMSIVTTDEIDLQLIQMSTAMLSCPGPYPWHWALHEKSYYLNTPEEDRLGFLLTSPDSYLQSHQDERYSNTEAFRWHTLHNTIPNWSHGGDGQTSWYHIQLKVETQNHKEEQKSLQKQQLLHSRRRTSRVRDFHRRRTATP